ncbi:TPA: hypothetical protein MO340_004274 [Salmonella enterica subsp. salamae serovar 35:g,m,s,t:-]|nr:hypothetical protein [Salmonella enterica subsp. salamae serovar 35:g,m,s,t:-]HCA3549744.1 hypothetical protein [Salmonella enterica subsp. salamae serovar 35:g,m,s,t:-]
MDNVHVKNWQDWEKLCVYWMKSIALRGARVDTDYQVYGRMGQKQHGVDIIPVKAKCGIVGQSKFVQKFELSDLKAELTKTDLYPNTITHYCILTTAPYCTSIQNALAEKPLTHTRPDGSIFIVHIYYWQDVKILDFLPESVIHTLFPEIKHTFVAAKKQPETLSAVELREKLLKLRALLKKTFTEENIKWLETWNFRSYNIFGTDYDAFHEPYLHWCLVESAIRENKPRLLQMQLNTESRIAFYETWPVSETFFFALEEFHKAGQNYVGGDYNAPIYYLTVSDLQNRDACAYKMEMAARYIAEKYREIMS